MTIGLHACVQAWSIHGLDWILNDLSPCFSVLQCSDSQGGRSSTHASPAEWPWWRTSILDKWNNRTTREKQYWRLSSLSLAPEQSLQDLQKSRPCFSGICLPSRPFFSGRIRSSEMKKEKRERKKMKRKERQSTSGYLAGPLRLACLLPSSFFLCLLCAEYLRNKGPG